MALTRRSLVPILLSETDECSLIWRGNVEKGVEKNVIGRVEKNLIGSLFLIKICLYVVQSLEIGFSLVLRLIMGFQQLIHFIDLLIS